MTKAAMSEMQSYKLHAVPLYSRLSCVFRDLIRDGTWKSGTGLPSETDLARRFGVSVGTARKALEDLEESGWITRRQGRGTFVTDPAEEQFARFNRLSLLDGQNVFSSSSVKKLDFQCGLASSKELVQLRQSQETKVVRLQRIHERDGSPVVLERYVLLAELFPDLEKRENIPVNVFGIFMHEFGVTVHRCLNQISATSADIDTARCLECEQGSPILHTFDVLESSNGNVIGVVSRWVDPEQAHYASTLT